MNDMTWYVHERIHEAYQFAENRRLARDARRSGPAWTVNPRRLRFFIQAFLKSNPGFPSGEAVSTLSPATDE